MFITNLPSNLAHKPLAPSMSSAKRLTRSASGIAASLLAALSLTCSGVSAHPNFFAAPQANRFARPQSGPMMSIEKELEQAALQFGVKIRTGEAVFSSDSLSNVAVVALQGIENYRQPDFTKGAPIQLIIVNSSTDDMPSGTFVVKAQFKPHATQGQALFTDQNGKVVAARPMLLRTWEQANILFPEIYVLPQPQPEDLPVISSTHIWHNGHYAVDCTGPGWNWVVIYY